MHTLVAISLKSNLSPFRIQGLAAHCRYGDFYNAFESPFEQEQPPGLCRQIAATAKAIHSFRGVGRAIARRPDAFAEILFLDAHAPATSVGSQPLSVSIMC